MKLSNNMNQVTVCGLLSEKNISVNEKNGKKYLSGNIKVEVAPENIVQVNVFSFEKTKDGRVNPSYEQIKGIMDNGVSLASNGNDVGTATKVRTTSGRLEENLFMSKYNNDVISSTRIFASFFNTSKINPVDFKATFECLIYIKNIREEMDTNGDATGRLLITGIVQQWNRYDEFTFVAESRQAVDYIQSNWEEGDTVSISGKIDNKIYTVTSTRESDGGFGEPTEETRTYSKTEYVITRGSEPKDEEFAYNDEDVKSGMLDRERLIEEKKSNTFVRAAKIDDSDF